MEILRLDEVRRHFVLPSAWARNGVKKPVLRAVDGVSLSLSRGETLGIVGESGSGKSTLARLVLGFDRPSSGSVHLHGEDLSGIGPAQWRAMRRRAQYVFQDTSGSLNPRIQVGKQIREGLDIHDIGPKADRDERVLAMFDAVGLDRGLTTRFPHQLSGGQQQRAVIARAIIMQPDLLVADEPVSALDLTVQAQVVELLAELQRDTQMAMIFISHDLKVVRKTTERIIVLYLGQIVEEGSTSTIFSDARHPYTNALLGAMLPANPKQKATRRFRIAGDLPNLLDLPSGCTLRPRCPFAIELCRAKRPTLDPVAPAHGVACHRAREMPELMSAHMSKESV